MSKFFALKGGQKTLSVFLSVILSLVLITAVTEAASTISTNISTDGTLTVSGNSTFGDAAGDVNLFTGTLQASTTALFSGTSVFYSNVGIGTSSPYAALSVVGSSGVVADIFVATSTTATSTVAGALGAASLTVGGAGVPSTITYVKKGLCGIITAGAAVAASTTVSFDCAVAGVVSGDTVFVQTPTGAASTDLTRFAIVGASASTTAGFISFNIANLTGAAAVIPAAFASSTRYLIVR